MTNPRTIIPVAVLAAMLFVVPSVAAQTVSIDTSSTKTSLEPLVPEIGQGEVTLAFTYSFPQSASSLVGAGQSTATATIDVSCTDQTNVIVTGPGSVSFPITPSGTTAQNPSFDYSGKFAIAVTRALPGLQKITCTYESFVDAINAGSPNTLVQKSNTVSGTFTVTAKFYSVVQAKVGTQIKQAGPQKEVPFEVQLTNFGNARTQIHFEIAERPGGSRWQAVVPDDIILDSPANNGPKQTDSASFTVSTPYKNGWNNEQGSFRLKMSTFAADDPSSTGIELFTNVLIRVRGVYVPSLEPFVMVGAVIGSALLARRLRDE